MSDRTTEAGRTDLEALDQSFGRIAYAPDGTILRANTTFLQMFGHPARDVVGGHHAIFMPTDEMSSRAYDEFWAALRRGERRAGDYRRVRQDGTEIWVQAIYTPVVDADGSISEIVAFATDVTATRASRASDRGQVQAIEASQAVIHFALDGALLDANELFCELLGYGRDDLVGRHHRVLVGPDHADTPDDVTFWARLAEGLPQAGDYKRLTKDGREVWLQTAYHPIVDLDGRPFKVAAYAVDVTADKLRQANYEGQIAAIGKSQAVITFDMDGTVVDANDLFLDAVGYRFDEVEGRHHRMFVDPSYSHGPEYAMFWSALQEGRHQAGEYRRASGSTDARSGSRRPTTRSWT